MGINILSFQISVRGRYKSCIYDPGTQIAYTTMFFSILLPLPYDDPIKIGFELQMRSAVKLVVTSVLMAYFEPWGKCNSAEIVV